jgi:hypothetical protein
VAEAAEGCSHRRASGSAEAGCSRQAAPVAEAAEGCSHRRA